MADALGEPVFWAGEADGVQDVVRDEELLVGEGVGPPDTDSEVPPLVWLTLAEDVTDIPTVHSSSGDTTQGKCVSAEGGSKGLKLSLYICLKSLTLC